MTDLRLLAVDIGAESGRGVVGRFDGQHLRVEEVHRFPNVPVQLGATQYWDFLRIYGDVLAAIDRASGVASVGVDTWGVDFGLLDGRGRLLANPVHYRDRRTAGVLDSLPRELVYAQTGNQFLEINTLAQLVAMVKARDPDLDRAERLLLIPDLISHFLCGSTSTEYTIATTSQCFNPRRGSWADELLIELGVPTGLFSEIVPPGTVLGTHASMRVVAPGTHDTASAVAAIPLDCHTAFLSSGTWSLLGLELDQPVINAAALMANLTNEGGVGGTIRLLANVMGLWLLQQARAALGSLPYTELTRLADAASPFTAFVDPDDVRFLRAGPGDIPSMVEKFCAQTGQPPPAEAGTLVRVLLESLALKYASVLEALESVTGRSVRKLHVVGGGVQNALLCQMTADATGRLLLAGPAEATAIGNLVVQAMALGEVRSLDEARELVTRSFAFRQYEPRTDWSVARERFRALLALGKA
jgi:rhamnulokinase